MRLKASGGDLKRTPVRTIMQTEHTTIAPETPTTEAIALMKRLRIGSLPVVQDGRLVGLVLKDDFMDVADKLLAEHGDADLGSAVQGTRRAAPTATEDPPAE
jgi:Mg/Co/Ni transporter MgtE